MARQEKKMTRQKQEKTRRAQDKIITIISKTQLESKTELEQGGAKNWRRQDKSKTGQKQDRTRIGRNRKFVNKGKQARPVTAKQVKSRGSQIVEGQDGKV